MKEITPTNIQFEDLPLSEMDNRLKITFKSFNAEYDFTQLLAFKNAKEFIESQLSKYGSSILDEIISWKDDPNFLNTLSDKITEDGDKEKVMRSLEIITTKTEENNISHSLYKTMNEYLIHLAIFTKKRLDLPRA